MCRRPLAVRPVTRRVGASVGREVRGTVAVLMRLSEGCRGRRPGGPRPLTRTRDAERPPGTGRPLDERDEVVTALGGLPPSKDATRRHGAHHAPTTVSVARVGSAA